MIYRVEISAEAMARLRDQAHYIAVEAAAPETAARWLQRVLDAADSLAQWPRRCPLAPEDAFFVFEIRACHIDGDLLLFTIDDSTQTVTIVNARHGRQQPSS